MNGMLFHQEAYRDGVERRQREAQDMARSHRLGRLARVVSTPVRAAPSRRRLVTAAGPMSALAAIVATAVLT